MRNLADADALAAAIAPGARALVVGGGYIGLEAAAVLREKGLEVTLIERRRASSPASPPPPPPTTSAPCTAATASRSARARRSPG